MHQVSITVPVSSVGAALLRAMADKVDSFGADVPSVLGASFAGVPAAVAKASPVAAAAPVAAPTGAKRGRKPNAEKAAAEAVAQDVLKPEDDELAGFDDSAPDSDDLYLGDELGLDAPETPKLTLEGDVVPAFRKFIEKHKGDKSKAGAILTKFGVKSVRDLPAEKYGEIVALLKK